MKYFAIVPAILIAAIMFIDKASLESQIKEFKRSNKELKAIALKQSESALNYQLIALELCNICDRYQSSRNAKNENKKYFELLKNVE